MPSFDVEDAFLTGKLPNRTTYARSPKGGIPDVPAGALMGLLKSCFRLQESPLLWRLGFHKTALSVGIEPVRGRPTALVF